MKTAKISKVTAISGVLLTVVVYLIPFRPLENILFFLSNDLLVSLLMSIMIVVIPLLGILGAIFSFIRKQWPLLIVNVLLIFNAQIAYFLSQLIYSF